jgi:hypothetical protein
MNPQETVTGVREPYAGLGGGFAGKGRGDGGSCTEKSRVVFPSSQTCGARCLATGAMICMERILLGIISLGPEAMV